MNAVFEVLLGDVGNISDEKGEDLAGFRQSSPIVSKEFFVRTAFAFQIIVRDDDIPRPAIDLRITGIAFVCGRACDAVGTFSVGFCIAGGLIEMRMSVQYGI